MVDDFDDAAVAAASVADFAVFIDATNAKLIDDNDDFFEAKYAGVDCTDSAAAAANEASLAARLLAAISPADNGDGGDDDADSEANNDADDFDACEIAIVVADAEDCDEDEDAEDCDEDETRSVDEDDAAAEVAAMLARAEGFTEAIAIERARENSATRINS